MLSKNLPEIFIILLQPYFHVRLCLLKLSKWWEGRTDKVYLGVGVYIRSVETQCKQGSWCFMLHSQRGSSSALCCITTFLPSQPLIVGSSPRRRDYPLPCLSEAGRGSQHGAFQPALPGPAPAASQALLFRLAQQGLMYWTRGQFILPTLPRQNDFS